MRLRLKRTCSLSHVSEPRLKRTHSVNHALLGRNPVARGLQPKRAHFPNHALLGRNPVARGLRPKRAHFPNHALLGRNPVARGLRPKRAHFPNHALLGRNPVPRGLRPKRAHFPNHALLGRNLVAHGLRPKRAHFPNHAGLVTYGNHCGLGGPQSGVGLPKAGAHLEDAARRTTSKSSSRALRREEPVRVRASGIACLMCWYSTWWTLSPPTTGAHLEAMVDRTRKRSHNLTHDKQYRQRRARLCALCIAVGTTRTCS